MSLSSVFGPIIAMVLLTLIVTARMATTRLGYFRREKIHPQKVALSAQMATVVADTRASDNYRNLFEMPVLFYLAMFAAHASSQTGTLVLALAWAYVVLRWLHSFIHCSYNRVVHRFAAFALSALVLLALWIVLAAGLFT